MRPILDIRQFLDTRGGLAAVIVTVVVTAGLAGLIGLIQPAILPDDAVTFSGPAVAVTFALWIMMPILAVLFIASDWSNASIQTTFLQRPARGAVLVSKIIAVVVVAAVVVGLGILAAWAATAIGGAISDHGASYASAGDDVLALLASSAGALAFGIAIAALVQSTALGLVAALALPFVVSLVSPFVTAFAPDWAADVFSLIDLNTATSHLATGDLDALDAACMVLLIVVPFVFGVIRWSRREVG